MKLVRRVSAVVTAVLLVAACERPAVTTGPPPTSPASGPATSAASPPAPSDSDWPTYHRDNARTGVAPGFPPVRGLASAWRARLDGAVYGQPLVIGDTVYAATEHDTVYALAADDGKVRWSTSLGRPMPRAQLPCGNIDPLGITGTMVYDPDTGLVFALAETEGGHHTLFGVDAHTGAIKLNRAAEPPKGHALAHQQRPALLLYNGRIHIAYGGLEGDCGRYIGAVVSVPTTGGGPNLSYAVPTTREGGIWATAGGIVHNGRLLYAVGNGESTSRFDGSDSVIALGADLRLLDWFAPSTWAEDNRSDRDLGSLAPAVVNGYVFIAGKSGIGYTLRPDRLGRIGGEVAQTPVCRGFGGPAVNDDVIYVPCRDGARAVRVDSTGRIKVLWHGPDQAAGSPVIGGGVVWVIDYDGGVLYALDPATGTPKHRISVGPAPHFASPTLSAGRVFIGTLSGVTAIRAT